MEKYGTAGQATDNSMAHARFTLGTKGYKHTLTTYNTNCFSTETVVARTRVPLYVHRLSCHF